MNEKYEPIGCEATSEVKTKDMPKFVLVKIGEFAQFGIENGQRTFRPKKKNYGFEPGDVVLFYRHMCGMDVISEGPYEVAEIKSGKQGPYVLLSYCKVRDCEDE